LQSVGFEEGFLHRMQSPVPREALDGDDALARHRPGFGNARFRGLPIHQHGARRALPFAAAVLGAGQIQVVTEHAQQSSVGVGIHPPLGAIDIQYGDPAHIGYYPKCAAANPGRKPPFRRLLYGITVQCP